MLCPIEGLLCMVVVAGPPLQGARKWEVLLLPVVYLLLLPVGLTAAVRVTCRLPSPEQ